MSLAVAGRPTNLHLPPGTAAIPVSSDMFDICSRVAEIDPNLYIVLTMQGSSHAYVIMEKCRDGVDRLVFRVNVLDQRVLNRLKYLMTHPLDERLKILEKEEYELKAEKAEREFEELYERVGRPMWTQLEHDGFIQRSVSYPKRGVKADGSGSR
jgi:hypothetical protein